MSTNGSAPTSRLDGIVVQLREALVVARSLEAEARLALASSEGERKKLEKMLELATVDPAKVKSEKKKAAAPGQRVGSSPAKVAAFREEARRKLIEVVLSSEPVFPDVEHSFTYKSLRESGWDHSDDLARTITREMREEGMVRMLGTSKGRAPGQKAGQSPVVFALINAQDDRVPVLAGADVSSG